jgi:hypothetical protein
MNKRYYDYQQNEAKKYQEYCGVGFTGSVKNPVQCQAFVSGSEQKRNAELKKREKDLNYIKGREAKLTKMSVNYNEYQKRQVANESRNNDNYDPTGSSYSNFEDEISDRFPGYYGPTQSTAYDPSMYNMGGQSASMNMGNTYHLILK